MEQTNFTQCSKQTAYWSKQTLHNRALYNNKQALHDRAIKLYTMEQTNFTQCSKQTLHNGANKLYTIEQSLDFVHSEFVQVISS